MLHQDFDLLYSGILRTFRRTLSHSPEPSGAEAATAQVIRSFLESYRPDELVTEIGGHGVAAVYKGHAPGPTILVRCELDALEVEVEGVPHYGDAGDRWDTSVAHLCGHDGHMTMVAGLAPLLQIRPLERGRVVLLFQPAEETGEGALRVINDPKFDRIRPDFALALHNLPGEPEGRVVVRHDTFSCASVGLRASFEGLASHAAEPELARTPAAALCELLSGLPALSTEGDSYRLLTVTHVHMGRPSFGVTPGHGELYATLRAVRDEVLADLREEVSSRVRSAAKACDVEATIEWSDEFPATVNDASLVGIVEKVCEAAHLEVRENDVAFRWSEDFGYFGRVCPSVCFGLGIGESQPPLHHPEYTFPDSVITTGVMVWSGLISALIGRES